MHSMMAIITALRLACAAWALLCLAMVSPGCTEQSGTSPGSEKLSIVCTTGMLADAARHIAGPGAEVLALMGPGVDPHSYAASSGDVQRLRQADLVLFNGLHLEGKMQGVLEQLGSQQLVLNFSEGLDPSRLRRIEGEEAIFDPHVWFDAALWASGVEALGQRMGEVFPAHRDSMQARAAAYAAQLRALHGELEASYASIPPENRVLVSSHDAFGYLGAAYGMEVIGLQGISTAAEYGLRDLTGLVELIATRRVPAVFVESSVSPRSMQSVVEGCKRRGWEVRIGGELFSDAMGAEGSAEGTYAGMLRHNARVLAAALGGAPPDQAGADASADLLLTTP